MDRPLARHFKDLNNVFRVLESPFLVPRFPSPLGHGLFDDYPSESISVRRPASDIRESPNEHLIESEFPDIHEGNIRA